jgi:hypothetical protein
MFRVTRNMAISETQLLSAFEERLRSHLPSSWSLELEPKPRAATGRPDALIRLRAPSGEEAVVVIEAKSLVEPRGVRSLLNQLSRWPDARPLVLAPFLSPRAREELAAAGAGYADATGNLRLELEQPALYIETMGATSNPWPDERPLRSLKGPSAGRVVRGLCDLRPPYGVRKLAGLTGASPASVSRVVELLDREALLDRGPRGEVTRVDWEGVIRRWVQDYSFTDSNRTETFLEARGLKALERKLATTQETYTVTGSLPAAAVAPLTAPRLATVYVSNASLAANVLDLHTTEAGANVLLVEPFDTVVFDRTWERNGLVFCALSQVAADLLTSPGRGPSEATQLLSWMGENEDAWRT